MAKNAHVSVLMERIKINEETFLFKPVSIMKGNLTEGGETFVDEYENMYFSYDDSYSEETHCFAGAFNNKDLQRLFPEDSKIESIQRMFDEALNTILIGMVSEVSEEKLDIVSIALDDLDLLISGYSQEFDEVDESQIESGLFLSESEMQDLLKINKFKDLKAALLSYNQRMLDEKKQMAAKLGFDIETEQDVSEKVPKSTLSKKVIHESDLICNTVNIQEMYKYITDRVVGQDEAVKQILTTFMMNKIDSGASIDGELTRMLITGPTGCGKTLIIEMMLEYLKEFHNQVFPFAKVPTSQLTVAGYVGMNLEDILSSLLSNTKGTFNSEEERIYYAERNGIVFFDEIDKKGSTSNGDVSGRGVLNSLLEFLTGANYEVEKGINVRTFNTKYLTIIAAGAFTQVYDSAKKSVLGFNQISQTSNEISPESFINDGMMPSELMGRFHKIVNLNPLT